MTRRLTPENAFRDALRDAVSRALSTEIDDVPLTYPPSAAQGDLASPVCFELARRLKKPPRALAEAIVAAFVPGPGIDRLEVAGGGYLNLFLDRTTFLKEWLVEDRADVEPSPGGKTIVEHTNINPNKAAHIGHLRNAILGDTLCRCLKQLGENVEIQNYIDDTGVQLADLVVGFSVLRGEDLATVRERYAEEELEKRGERFDYVAWDLYAEVTRYYEEDESRLAHRRETLHRIEEGGNDTARLGDYLAGRMVRHHLRTMERIGVRYDLLPRESDIVGLGFWTEAFRRLKESSATHLVTEGKNEGCWVMDLPGVERGSGEDQKILVRSNGTVTYVGKDIAYQMWKFGLLDRDFAYVPLDWGESAALYPVWSTAHPKGAAEHPAFGRGATVYNVIDTRQSYPQRVVALGLRSLGHDVEADRSIHFAYEMVALSPATILAMFPDYPLGEEERKKPYLEMSGRRGLGVRADDLVDALLDRAAAEVRKRNPEHGDDRVRETARKIAVGALRYYMLRFSRNRVVAFDLDAALAFEGETGPYLQYSVVRAKNILAKVADRHGAREVDAPELARNTDLSALPAETLAEHWNLALLLSRQQSVLRQAVLSLELAAVAKHAYILAQAFNSFYHRYQVAREEDAAIRRVRASLVRLYHDGMTHLLGTMGIEVPDRM